MFSVLFSSEAVSLSASPLHTSVCKQDREIEIRTRTKSWMKPQPNNNLTQCNIQPHINKLSVSLQNQTFVHKSQIWKVKFRHYLQMVKVWGRVKTLPGRMSNFAVDLERPVCPYSHLCKSVSCQLNDQPMTLREGRSS